MKRIKRIVYATDFSRASTPAFSAAVNLAASVGARLAIVHVVSGLLPLLPDQYFDPSLYERLKRDARAWSSRRLQALAARARKQGAQRVTTVTREGDPATEIIRMARAEHADLLITGTHGRGGVPRFLIGSVADRLVRTAPCAVMTVRSR